MINIKVRVRHLIAKYGTRNPEILAKELGIIIKRKAFKGKTMGFFQNHHGLMYITVNSNLPEALQIVVIAHELGHAVLHASKTAMYTHKYTLTPPGKAEIAANKFAAELLVNEEVIDAHYLEEMTVSQLALFYGVPNQLIEYKFNWKN
jgi:Zn-dependent peptidase ImmA (M78 family)